MHAFTLEELSTRYKPSSATPKTTDVIDRILKPFRSSNERNSGAVNHSSIGWLLQLRPPPRIAFMVRLLGVVRIK